MFQPIRLPPRRFFKVISVTASGFAKPFGVKTVLELVRSLVGERAAAV